MPLSVSPPDPFEHAPVGLALLDAGGRYVRVNAWVCRASGLPAEAFTGRTPRETWAASGSTEAAAAAEAFEHAWREAVESGEPRQAVLQGCLPGEPSRRWRVGCQPLGDGTAAVSFEDVTDLVAAQTEAGEAAHHLAEGERRRLEAILAQLPTGVALVDLDAQGGIYLNEASRRLLVGTVALDAGDSDPRAWLPYRPDGEPIAYGHGPLGRATRGEQVTAEEIRFPRTDGSWLHLLINAGPVRDDEGRIVAAVAAFEDVTDRREAEETVRALNNSLEARVRARTAQARRLALALARAEQHERARIGQVLHDEVQQVLFGARLKLDTLAWRLEQEAGPPEGSAEGLAKGLADVHALLDEAVRLTRGLTADLYPTAPSAEGVAQALRVLAEAAGHRHGLRVGVEVAGEAEKVVLDEDAHTLVAQIVRELLFNVVKHAGVNEASVSLHREPGGLMVVVADAGVGFDPEAALTGSTKTGPRRGASGFGLTGIRDRLALLDGRLDVASARGGTRVTLTLPNPSDSQTTL